LQMLFTFALVVIGWIIFRAPNIPALFHYLQNMWTPSLFSIPWHTTRIFFIPLVVLLCLIFEWFNRYHEHGLARCGSHRWQRYIVYIALWWSIAFFGGEQTAFIYFQF
jgi:hypothetical protein